MVGVSHCAQYASSPTLIAITKSFLLSLYQVKVSGSVFSELTDHGYPDSDEFKMYQKSGLMMIHHPDENGQHLDMTTMNHSGLDRGEHDTILLFLSGNADFIIVDDGKAARFCYKNHIPFINALLFPRILAMAGSITKLESMARFNDVSGLGRYSERIIQQARLYSTEDLEQFLPESPIS